jgi:hypothetical protein
MKHLLNDLTEKEKNSIREQHTGGMKVVTENFSKLINAKSGEAKSFLKEESDFKGELSYADETDLMIAPIMNIIKPVYEKYGLEGVSDFLSDIIGMIGDLGDEAFMGPEDYN